MGRRVYPPEFRRKVLDLVLAGGFGRAIGNVANARAQAPNPLHLTLWMSVVPPVPMLALSLAVEGPSRIASSLHLTAPGAILALLGLVYTVVLSTIAGSVLWSWLMARPRHSTRSSSGLTRRCQPPTRRHSSRPV